MIVNLLWTLVLYFFVGMLVVALPSQMPISVGVFARRALLWPVILVIRA